MAYETGTSTGPADLLQKLETFASGEGWTVNQGAVEGSGYRLHISKSGLYFNFRAYNNETCYVSGTSDTSKYHILMNGSDSYDGADDWDDQPGAPDRYTGTGEAGRCHAGMCDVPGGYTAYHFFAGTDFIHIELEFNSNKFQRMGFGQLALVGTSGTEGAYFYGSFGFHPSAGTYAATIDNTSQAEHFPFRAGSYVTSGRRGSSFVRINEGGFNGWASSGRNNTSVVTDEACSGGGVHDYMLRECSADNINGLGVLIPCLVSYNQGSYLSPFGTIPELRQVNIKNIDPGQEITFGSDTWKCFPWYEKTGFSGNRGIAYKKVT